MRQYCIHTVGVCARFKICAVLVTQNSEIFFENWCISFSLRRLFVLSAAAAVLLFFFLFVMASKMLLVQVFSDCKRHWRGVQFAGSFPSNRELALAIGYCHGCGNYYTHFNLSCTNISIEFKNKNSFMLC